MVFDIYYYDALQKEIPSDPSGLENACSLDLNEFQSIKMYFDACKMMGINIDFFSDNILSVDETRKVYSVFLEDKAFNIDKRTDAYATYKKISGILAIATAYNKGLLMYCD